MTIPRVAGRLSHTTELSRSRLTTIVLATCLAATAAWAAQPDAGALRQQIEQQRAVPLPQQGAGIDAPQTASTSPEGQTSVTVQVFRFVGNSLLAGEELERVVAPYLHHPITFNELQQATAAVARAYRDAGWLVNAYLPRQEIIDGAVTIRIVEAVYSGARMEGAEAELVPAAQLLAHFDARQQTGEALNLKQLDRALLLADDLPGVAVAGSLQAGQQLGETELLLHATDEPPHGARLLLDNAGARSTGASRVIAMMHLYSPTHRGDQFDGTFLHSKGTDYLSASYSMPFGQDGWRVDISGAYLDYGLTASDFSALEGTGRSTSASAGSSYPLIRTRQHNLYLDVRFARDAYRNRANSAVQSNYYINAASFGLTGNRFDDFGGGGSTQASFTWTKGRLALHTLDLGESPAVGGVFNTFDLRVSRQQVISGQWTLLATMRGQLGSKLLDSSQRFYLGGPNGVRAYPVNEGSGNRGALLNFEMRRRLPYNTTVATFYDWGHVGNPGPDASYDLSGYGVSMSWQAPHRIELETTLARRLGHNPNPLSTGRDQDGSLDRTRLWLALSRRF
jgi:hemolysin activation/secretion protein